MKSIVTAAFAICLMSGSSALAANNSSGPHSGSPHVSGTPHTTGGPNPSTLHTGPITAGPQFTSHTQTGPTGFTPQFRNRTSGPQNFGNPNNNNNNGPITTFRRNTGPTGPTGPVHTTSVTTFHPKFGAPGFNPGGQRPRYSPTFFPHTFNLGARFHWRGQAWYGPQGYYYRPWYYGQILPFGWFASQWWINDYYDYDLPVPPYGYEWVRNGPDALLVDVNTGEVVEDIPGAFY